MKRTTVALFFPALGAALVGGYLLFTGPDMKSQPHLRPFQAAMPPSPKGSVPLSNPVATMPSTQEAQELVQRLFATANLAEGGSATAEGIARGKVYYGRYCLACHGEGGDGAGPVGESLAPMPTDLRSSRVRGLSDGQLLRAMLTGPTHEPVLPRVVPADARPYLVLYVRQFAVSAR